MSARQEYNTRAFTMVLDCLKAGGRHMTAEDITYALCKDGRKIGKTTVYRNLEKLLARGLIARCQTDEGACYCVNDSKKSAPIHLKCSSCGRLMHLECEQLDTLMRHISSEHNFLLDRHRTVLYGVCSECRI